MGKYLLGIDQGTSGCKVCLFDLRGNTVASSAGSYPTQYPQTGWVEQHAQDWWRAVCGCIREVLSNVDPKEVSAIGVDGTSWAGLPVDCDGVPLTPAMIWMDRRSHIEAEEMKEIFQKHRWSWDNPPDAAYQTPKAMWLRKNKPDIWQKTRWLMQSNGWLAFQLTGEVTQDASQGYGFHCYDMANACWDGAKADACGIPLDKLPPVVQCHDVIGTVTARAALETGLAQGTKVVAGGLDAACCTLGAGVTKIGQTQEQGGQAGGMSIVLDRPLPHRDLILGAHVIPNRWLLQGGTTGGGSLRWLSELLHERDFDKLGDMAATLPPGAEGTVFLPYMAGERSPLWDANARGVFFGLSYQKSREHMARSVMEGVAYALRHNIEVAVEAGADVRILHAVGGASKSAFWTQLKSDITGLPIAVPQAKEATPLGAAMLAGIGAGIYADVRQAVVAAVRQRRLHMPDETVRGKYDTVYGIYRKLYDVNKGLMTELTDLED